MLVASFQDFVRSTDQTKKESEATRRDIAVYGVVGEVGSLISAVKKRMLSEDGVDLWEANREIVDELGDALWYTFLMNGLENGPDFNILLSDLRFRQAELSGSDELSNNIRSALAQRDPNRLDEFLRAVSEISDPTGLTLDRYQEIAFLTARTDGRQLLEVCMAVLIQLVAELMKTKKLPNTEVQINTVITHREVTPILGEITWHLAAVAGLFQLKLSDVIERNREKLSFRFNKGMPSALHDEGYQSHEQFPRTMEIAFVTVAKGRSRMYLNGRQLGDELTDNAHDDDGYRFHDVLHLANVAKLGWSPVMRSLLGRKRKSNPRTDEVEDGARAKIVEEAVVKFIHSEGLSIARARTPTKPRGPERLFSGKNDVTFRFLKMLNEFCAGLEASKNRYWEWEDAIRTGCDLFYELGKAGQGTVVIDLVERSAIFRPDVSIDIKGVVAGLGTAHVPVSDDVDGDPVESPAAGSLAFGARKMAELLAVKRAVLSSLDLNAEDPSHLESVVVVLADEGKIGVSASGPVREAMWDRQVITFKCNLTAFPGQVSCTALAMCDAKDAVG